MAKVKTSELLGPALDWVVADIEGRLPTFKFHTIDETPVAFVYMQSGSHRVGAHYSTAWAQGGSIIEREGFELSIMHDDDSTLADRKWSRGWLAGRSVNSMRLFTHEASGPTPLVAAMRCFVASRRGNKVEVPKELAQ